MAGVLHRHGADPFVERLPVMRRQVEQSEDAEAQGDDGNGDGETARSATVRPPPITANQ